MKWYKDLYIGESITGKSEKIKWKIRHGAGLIEIYIVSLAGCSNDLLDIIPSWELMQKSYPVTDLFIVGLAKGWEEAVEVAAGIVMETFENTGGFDVSSYIDLKMNGYRGRG